MNANLMRSFLSVDSILRQIAMQGQFDGRKSLKQWQDLTQRIPLMSNALRSDTDATTIVPLSRQ